MKQMKKIICTGIAATLILGLGSYGVIAGAKDIIEVNTQVVKDGSSLRYPTLLDGNISSVSKSGIYGTDNYGGANLVDFWDVNFETEVRKKLNKMTGSILKSDVLSITTLNLSGKKISDLRGIEAFVSLTSLDLSSNSIDDIYKLAGLTKLTSLKLDKNKITSVTALSKLTSLKTLGLSSNQITDITSLSNLTKLTSLSIQGNKIASLASLEKLTLLTTLNLKGNKATDYSPLRPFYYKIKTKDFSYTIPDMIKVNGKDVSSKLNITAVSGKTMVSLQQFFTELKVSSYKYDSKAKTVSGSKGSIKVVLKLDSTTAKVGTKSVTLEGAVKLVSSKPYGTVKSVAQCFGAQVSYDNNTKTYSIITQQ